LKGSHKWASRHTAGPDDRFTYTILLHNSGTQSASVDVEDDLPSHVSYVSGSANQGGAYNDGAGTISWNDVSVPAGGEKRLTFDVQAGSVDYPRLVVNKATIRTGDDPFERIAPVLLLPESLDPDFDHVHPWVGDLTIGDRDVLGSRSVTLHISAGDDKGVTEMYVREWQLVTSFPPHWEVVRSSGWVPFQENYPWTLGSESGTHYVGVWVSDHAKNVSWFGGYAMDFASLLLPGESLASKESVPYLVHYEAGVNVTATLAPSSGDADLYVWYPGHHAGVDQKSTKSGTNVDQVSFTTPRDGIYLFLVHAYTATTYDLSITPAGGPRAYLADAAGVEAAGQPAPAGEVDAQAKVELTAEPVLIYSGLDPMDVAPPQVAQVARETIYLPLIVR
jgi:uncharacterized repeat protein (TIGR01451 family)